MNAPQEEKKGLTAEELTKKFFKDNFLATPRISDSQIYTNLINSFREVFHQGALAQQNNFTLIAGKKLEFHHCAFSVIPGDSFEDDETLPEEEKK